MDDACGGQAWHSAVVATILFQLCIISKIIIFWASGQNLYCLHCDAHAISEAAAKIHTSHYILFLTTDEIPILPSMRLGTGIPILPSMRLGSCIPILYHGHATRVVYSKLSSPFSCCFFLKPSNTYIVICLKKTQWLCAFNSVNTVYDQWPFHQ